jgi:dienelactone hydrolase
MNFKYVVCILLNVSFLAAVSGQHPVELPGTGFSLFELPHTNGDTTRFVISGTPAEISGSKKPVFLFWHGSLPIPLLIQYGSAWFGTFPFDTAPFRGRFHFAVISKPGLPLTANMATLDPNLCVRDSASGKPPRVFTKNNHLDYFTAQGKQVLDFLHRQPWVDASKTVVCGGSQGATVSAKLAALDPRISHLIYYSGNPNGRADEEVRRLQLDVFKGKISGEEAVERMVELQNDWSRLYANENQTESDAGDPPKTTVSFSKPARDYLLQLDIPILVAFGTADITAAPCATLPLDFLRAGKKNLTLKAYPDYDHSFFRLKKDGSEPEYRLDQAFAEWMEWLGK